MHYVQGQGYMEASGRKVCSKREMTLRLARAYGYENDINALTRLVIESRTNRQALKAAWLVGRNAAIAKANGGAL